MFAEDLDEDKIAEAALAILSLSLHETDRVWNRLDWGAMDSLFKRGWISDPVSKAKSVFLADERMKLSDAFLYKYFGKS